MDLLDKVKASYDCRRVAEQLGVKVASRSGKSYKCHCFNADSHNNGDRNPSLAVFDDGYKCFGCGVHGDVVQLYMDITSTPFKRALRELAKRTGIDFDSYEFDADREQRKREVKPVVVERSRIATFGRIWRAVEPTTLPDRAKQYLEGRGIAPAIAYAYGCRDWSEAKDDILDILRQMTTDDYKRAGLLNGDGKIWAALRSLNGDSTFDGLAFPVYHPDHPSAPIGVRWRLYQQWPDGPKSLAQPSSDPPIQQIPLGLRILSRDESELLYWWPHKTDSDVSPERVIVLTEGELDWLSVAESAQAIEAPVQVVPVGICAMSSGFPEGLVEFLLDARQVVLLFDRGSPQGDDGRPMGYKVAADVARMLTDRIGLSRTRQMLTCNILPDDYDANDHHVEGKLVPLLRRLIKT